MDKINIAENIVRLRRKKRITQEQLADFLGITKASVSKWEMSYTMPDIQHLPRLAAYFDVTIDELIGYEPQLDEKQICAIYEGLTREFVEKDFKSTFEKSEELVKEYYTCYPFLLYIAVLWQSHLALAPEEDSRLAAGDKIILLCNHILENCQDIIICDNVITVKEITALVTGKASEVISDLEDSVKKSSFQNKGYLLSLAYMEVGNKEEADTTLQVEMYKNIIMLISHGMNFLLLNPKDSELTFETIHRLDMVLGGFEIDKVNPKFASGYYHYVTISLCLLLKECKINPEKYKSLKTEEIETEAYKYLKKFIHSEQISIKQGLGLRGDRFFTKLEEWDSKSDIGITNIKNYLQLEKDIVQILHNNIFTEVLDAERLKVYEGMFTEYGKSANRPRQSADLM
jgi:transcriptional regulator with XRE-family HTH domain